MKTLGLAITMLLPHGVSAIESGKQAVQQDISKTISLQDSQTERSDTFYLSNQEKPHSEIIKMSFGTILKLYGKEKGLEMVRQHFLQEINKQRAVLGNLALTSHTVLNDVAQSKAQDMADNDYFDHTDKQGVSDAGRLVKDGRYKVQMFGSNISYNIKNIGEVVQSYVDNKKRNTGHYDVISVKDYKDLGVGLAMGKNGTRYIVVNYGAEFSKK
ncbi:MAG: CAP domain-containing protein [candidate division SR1 bacterium]|nr:CAP domain-containing protein [candidate division SR1 bacterium]